MREDCIEVLDGIILSWWASAIEGSGGSKSYNKPESKEVIGGVMPFTRGI
jgi:hypothetical protein